MKGHQRRKQYFSQKKKKKKEEKKEREENTWETILIQKISCIKVKIKKKKKKELFRDFNLSTFVIVRNLTI